MDPTPKFREFDEHFMCDCGDRDHSINLALIDDSCLIISALDESALNTPWHWRFMSALRLFWDYFWKKQHTIEVVLNRQEHRKWKKFVENLKDERCWNCDPDYTPKGSYYEHKH